ncbi:MAG: carbohydrate-binding family 9-like protein [Pyrinomonadaceae bacterium]
MIEKRIKIARANENFSVNHFDNKNWQAASESIISKYWSGETAPVGRHFKTKILWSETALYVRFEVNQNEPLIVSEKPNLTGKTRGLWDRDVCEIFLAPNRKEPRKYFEFEIAPNGEWIDLGIYQKPDERITDWDYNSGMQSATKIEENKITMAIKVEWKAFGKTPKAGDIWLGNIYRCVGAGKMRGYLAWSPTETKEPAFHVPEKFGEFEFAE